MTVVWIKYVSDKICVRLYKCSRKIALLVSDRQKENVECWLTLTHTRTQEHRHIHIYTCTHTHIHTHTHTYTHVHTHTRTHTYIKSNREWRKRETKQGLKDDGNSIGEEKRSAVSFKMRRKEKDPYCELVSECLRA